MRLIFPLLIVLATSLGAWQAAWAEKTGTVFELINTGSAKVTAQGNGINSVSVCIDLKKKEDLTVTVPAGTYFEARNAAKSNMVALTSSSITVPADAYRHSTYILPVPAASTNFTRNIPVAGNLFTIQRSSPNKEITRVVLLMAKARVSYPVSQAAIWIVTDNVTSTDLDTLISRPEVFSKRSFVEFKAWERGTKVINPYEAARAIRYCADAGVNITSKAIWTERKAIAAALDDSELKYWIGFDSYGYLQVTSTPPGAIISVDGQRTGQTTPCRVSLRCITQQPRSVIVSAELAGFLPTQSKMTVTAETETPCALTLAKITIIPMKTHPGEVCVNPMDGAKMVWVPAGTFRMGTSENEFASFNNADPYNTREMFETDMPQHNIYLDAYYMYQTEVTVAQYRKFCEMTGHEMPEAPDWGWKDTHPIVNVTWEEAQAYAKWAGGALPTEAQWEKAARGGSRRLYPWGNGWNEAKCVNDGTATKPVGSIPADTSPYGCRDMAGNVSEWCADWQSDDYYRHSSVRNPPGPGTGNMRIVRGGSWDATKCSPCPYNFRTTQRSREEPRYASTDRGFRCVVHPSKP